MALSERAVQLKTELMAAVTLTRALEAARQEWEDLLYLGEMAEWQPLTEQWVANVQAERYALQKQLAQAQLKNWARIRQLKLTDGQWRVMRLRYVQGLTWAQIVERCGNIIGRWSSWRGGRRDEVDPARHRPKPRKPLVQAGLRGVKKVAGLS